MRVDVAVNIHMRHKYGQTSVWHLLCNSRHHPKVSRGALKVDRVRTKSSRPLHHQHTTHLDRDGRWCGQLNASATTLMSLLDIVLLWGEEVGTNCRIQLFMLSGHIDYLAIDSIGNLWVKSSRSNCSVVESFLGKPSWCRNERVCQEVKCKGLRQTGYLDLLDLWAMLAFERWQSANKGLPLGSVIDHLGGIDGVEASRMEIVFGWIRPSGFGAASWSLPAMDVRVEVKDSSYREGGWHAVEMSEPAQAALS